MDTLSFEEALNLYDESGETGAPGQLAGLSAEALAELESLARVRRLLKQTLAPVPARLAFREDLGQSLLSTALQRQGWRGMVMVNLRSHWKLTAATASGVSVAVGAIGVVAWYRGRS